MTATTGAIPTSFNGAAGVNPRMGRHQAPRRPLTQCFNGAAGVNPRMVAPLNCLNFRIPNGTLQAAVCAEAQAAYPTTGFLCNSLRGNMRAVTLMLLLTFPLALGCACPVHIGKLQLWAQYAQYMVDFQRPAAPCESTHGAGPSPFLRGRKGLPQTT